MTELDLSIYYPIPKLTAKGYISLMKTLILCAPKNPPTHVAEAIDTFKKARAMAKAQIVERIDEDLSTGLDRLFDGFVDHVWVYLRDTLEFATIYTHAGAARLTDEDREQLEIEDRLAEAHTAAKIHRRIFGDGVDFLRSKYPIQSEEMASRLDWVESKNFEEALEEIVGPKLLTLLKVCQNRYEAMVSERQSHDGKSIADLGKLRQQLRREVYAYVGAIGTLHKSDKPETADIVANALLPILIVREENRRAALDLASILAAKSKDKKDETDGGEKDQKDALDELEELVKALSDEDDDDDDEVPNP